AWLLLTVVGFAPTAFAQSLTFSEALTRSEESPVVAARADALEAAQRSIGPAGALPDPELVLGLENVPSTGPDRFRLDRDEMTMQRIGIMQEMPSFAELGARRAMARAEAERAGAGVELGRLEARLGTAQAWIGLYYAERRVALLASLEREARSLAEAARGRLAAGGSGVDAAIAAEVEAARLEDRSAEAVASVVAMRAELRRWIGDAADEPISDDMPSFAFDPDMLRNHLRRHPALVAYDAEVSAAQAGLQMAQAQRWPDWSWEVSYGRRDPVLEDMASIEVRVGLPLFQPWRQGPLIAARRADLDRVGAEREATLREQTAILETLLARHQALVASVARARDIRLPLARRRAEAATGAFEAGSISSSAVIAARRDALEAELDLIDLEERLALVSAGLTLQYAEAIP
ncbi:MAG: TolC family protein, partial [Hyphomonadaceae bacterium]|nr:TolC family protein [Hyphomonadaceae bacterium]